MKICLGSLRKIIKEDLKSNGYYDLELGMKISDVLDRWVNGQKVYDRSMPVTLSWQEVWPYREYTWSRISSRRTPEEWDSLKLSMEKDGWSASNPAHVQVGKNRRAKLGEGNHRLAIARELDLKVPVFFHFYSEVLRED